MLPLFIAVLIGAWGIPPSSLPQPAQRIENQTQPTQQNASPKPSAEKQKEESNQRPGKKENEEIGEQSLVERAVKFVRQYNAEIVTISTAIMALFTVTLFFATFGLWRGGERHSERELRAYLSLMPRGVMCKPRTVEITGIDCLMKNHGETPAFEINHIFGIDVFTVPLGKDFKFPAPSIRLDDNITIFPNTERLTWFHRFLPLTAAEWSGIKNDTRRVFVWGVMTYRDAFNKSRHTNFSVSAGGQEFADNLRAFRDGRKGPDYRWTYGNHGNEAT